jgi:sulfur carrier protein ThiS adenylyltransferase
MARLGVGRLVLVDFDVVEPSNLNRQQYFIHQLGQAKTAAMTENLVRITPYVHVRTHNARITRENAAELFDGVDVLVEAFDTADCKEMLLETFHAARPEVPIVLASGLAGVGPGGELIVRRMGKNIYVVGDGVSEAGPCLGLMSPRVGIAAHLQANVVLRLLLGMEGT